jgi:hypothetical protein
MILILLPLVSLLYVEYVFDLVYGDVGRYNGYYGVVISG